MIDDRKISWRGTQMQQFHYSTVSHRKLTFETEEIIQTLGALYISILLLHLIMASEERVLNFASGTYINLMKLGQVVKSVSQVMF